jgi:hypothetical protein
VKYAPSNEYWPTFVWYDATYVVLAAIGTAVSKSTCCQPLGVSPVAEKIAVAIRVPLAVHRLPVCVPVFIGPL